MVEAMVALVIMDQLMAQHAQGNLFPINTDLQEPLFSPRLNDVDTEEGTSISEDGSAHNLVVG